MSALFCFALSLGCVTLAYLLARKMKRNCPVWALVVLGNISLLTMTVVPVLLMVAR